MAAKSVSMANGRHEKNTYTEGQIIGFIKQAEAVLPIEELCRKDGFSKATFCNWRAKYGGMDTG